MYRIESQLQRVKLDHLRPTQMTVGFREVTEKRKEWSGMGGKKRRRTMEEMLFPVVVGPRGCFFVLDHHHAAVALVREKAADVQVGIVKDLSKLTETEFWVYLDHLSWVHPYDAHGKRCALKDMPPSFLKLKNDPYRSLAGDVRDAGGFAKSDEPYLEFLWSNFFRDRITLRILHLHYQRAIKSALKLARSKKAAHLPGWAGSED
jgi:hypothetical protein